MSPAFIRAFNFVTSANVEGVFTDDPNDSGNWTGGEKGKGELKGSKYGISAASYPSLDIKSLRLDDARTIYYRDFWLGRKCDRMPPKLALAYFCFALNTREKYAVQALQRAVGVADDGVVGPQTLGAASAMAQEESVPNFLAEQAQLYVGFKGYPRFGRGWMERVVRTAMELGR